MKLNQLGEFGLLRRIRRRIPSLPLSIPIGIGDDAAVLRCDSSRDLVVTKDLLVEGVDFDLKHSPSLRQIGQKALAVNLSDIASMGALPRAFLVGIAAPGSLTTGAIDQLYSGMLSLARKHKMALVGGDLTASRLGLFISITILGEVASGCAVTRSGARSGDHLYVTGSLGDSRAGLEILKKTGLRNRSKRPGFESWLIRRHYDPSPRVEVGQALVRKKWAVAMIDLSDGLASDLRHLCRASRVGANLEAARLPLSSALRAYTLRSRRNALEYALRGGEDFELLFTVRKNRVAAFAKAVKQNRWPITNIGRMVSPENRITLSGADGKEKPLKLRGYEHFSK